MTAERKPDRVKDPYDVFDEAFDWSGDVPAGTSISAHTFAVTGGGGLAVADGGVSGLVTTARISTGLAGTYGLVTGTADFDNGEKLSRSVAVLVRDL